LNLVGGKKPQMRKAGPRDWTKAKESKFLSVLAETCNVTRAAEEAGVFTSSAYKRRKENAAFRAAWLEAISVAYQRLELVLLDRAFNGTEKVVKRRDGSEERMLEYSNQLGLTLLKMHRDTAVEAATEFQPDQIEELRERLFKKFCRLKKRFNADEAAGQWLTRLRGGSSNGCATRLPRRLNSLSGNSPRLMP
jgi:hypothetical protein